MSVPTFRRHHRRREAANEAQMGERITHLPMNKHTKLCLTTTGASNKSAPYSVKKSGKNELTATSNAYASSTLLSMAGEAAEESKRRLERK